MQNIWLNFPITRWLRIGAYTQWRVGQDAHDRFPADEKGRSDKCDTYQVGEPGKSMLRHSKKNRPAQHSSQQQSG